MIGGIEWYIYNISRTLVKMGHHVDVICVNRYGEETAPAKDCIEGINIRRLPLRVDLSYRLKVWDGLDDALSTGGYDVIHTYDYAQFHSYVALNAGRKTDTPVALTVFDIHSLIPRPALQRFAMRFFDRVFARWPLEAADSLFVRSPLLAILAQKLGGRVDRMVLTPPGVNDDALDHADGSEFREMHDIRGPLILYVGRIHPSKGLKYLLLAAPQILATYPTAKLVLAGPDQRGYTGYLRALANQLGLEGSILFPGPIRDPLEKRRAYAACDVFVLPSGYEGFGQVLLEAMAQSKPVVATKVGSIPWLVQDGVDGLLIDYANHRMLADAVRLLLADRGLAGRLGVQGYEKATRFRYSNLTNELSETYSKMLPRR